MPSHYGKKHGDSKMMKKDEGNKKMKMNGKAKATKKRGKAGAGSWISHVKQVAKKRGISYKEALKVASKSYKKK